MAAVFALVFLPALASTLFFLGSDNGLTFGSVAAALTFSMLAGGIFYGLLQMTRGWEGDHEGAHQ